MALLSMVLPSAEAESFPPVLRHGGPPSCLCDRKVELRDRTVESNEGTFWRIMAAVRLKEREAVYSNNTCIICFQKIWQESAFVFQFHSQKEKKAKPHDTRKAALARVF